MINRRFMIVLPALPSSGHAEQLEQLVFRTVRIKNYEAMRLGLVHLLVMRLDLC